jgi:hypothetical protein
MKYLSGMLLFAGFISSNLYAQDGPTYPKPATILELTAAENVKPLDEASIKKMMQGEWQQKDDESFTLTISNDTIMEVSKGDNPGTDIFKFTVTQTNCSKDALNGSLTGFYLDELNVNNNKHLCGSIDLISDTRMKLSYGDQLMEFKRSQ